MTVYVDDMLAAFRRMKMCHMMADTTEELLAMADLIGVQRKWLQKAGTSYEHFDIAMSKRKLAVAAGAKEVTRKELGRFMLSRRSAGLTDRQLRDQILARASLSNPKEGEA